MASSGMSLVRRAAEAVRGVPRWQKRLVVLTVG
jgi:NADH:ubiquinone reductase (non-electrogenic)